MSPSPEARRMLETVSPSSGSRATYAAAAKPKLVSIGCQAGPSCFGGAVPGGVTVPGSGQASSVPTGGTRPKSITTSQSTSKPPRNKPTVPNKPKPPVSEKPKFNSSRPTKMMKDLVKVNSLEGEAEEMDLLNYEEEDLDLPVSPTPDTTRKKPGYNRGKTLQR